MSFFTLSPIQKREINKVLIFVLVWFGFALVFGLIQKSILIDSKFYPNTNIEYNFVKSLLVIIPSGVLIGLIFGLIEVIIFQNRLRKLPFGIMLFFKIILYTILILFLITIATYIGYAITLEKSMFNAEVHKISINYISNNSFWIIIFYGTLAFGVSLFLIEISDNLGQGVLKNFLIGKYHKPREEERIFMFLDMKSSTTIAEKLGHVDYFKLLNNYFVDMTKVILKTSGKIYQYVGDEIIVYWDIEKGIKNNNCVECFFLIKELFNSLSNKYKAKYGITPGFKAGFHYGKVTTGEIGIIKKEIVFSGDVLNTTARIQNECNTFGVDILVSSDLISILDSTKYNTSELGEIKLRGKNSSTKLFSIENQ